MSPRAPSAAPVAVPTQVTVRRRFATHGKAYEPGDVFPWQDLGITDRKVRAMYQAGLLTLDPPEALKHLRRAQEPPHRRAGRKDD